MSWHRPAGTTARDGWDVVIEPDASGWQHTGLYAAQLAPGDTRTLAPGDRELVVIPLSGSVTVSGEDAAGRHSVMLTGRESVFAGPTDIAYLPAGSSLTVEAVGVATVAVAVAFAVVTEPGAAHAFRRVTRDEVPVELRGAGIASREVRNFGTPGVLDADSIIACEVVTPAGNWSSYPPHKHDEERPGLETELEEIYYFEVQRERAGGGRADPVAYQRVYGTDERPIDVLAEVRSGDVVLVPHGWHGPAMAPPGYDLYYLNVMAGPGEQRAWLVSDDPAHAWVRETWSAQALDPRLPFGGKQ